MKRIQSWLRVNPIIVKELRSRMRGPRAFITLTVVLLLTGAVMYGMLQFINVISQNYGSTILSPQVGQMLLTALAFLELVMICAITPAVTAGAISGEREKQTYEMLQATPLSPASLVWGKLVSALSYVLLLLFAAVPLASVVFIFGGVVARDMLKALVVLLVLATAFGVLGLFMSALFGRTGRATVASFLIVLALVFVPLVVGFATALIPNGRPARWLLAGSPVGLLLSTFELSSGMGGFDLLSILGGYWLGNVLTPVSTTAIPRPLYHYGIPFYLGITLILYLLTTRLVQPARRWRLTRAEWITALGLLVGFAALLTIGFYATVNRYEWANRGGSSDPSLLPATEAPAFFGPEQTGVVEVTVDPALAPTPTPIDTPTPLRTPALEATPAGALPPPVAAFGAEDTAEIYTAVARELFARERALYESQGVIYVLAEKAAAADDAETVHAMLRTGLSDLLAEIEVVGDRNTIPADVNSGVVEGDGVVFTLGQIDPQADGSVHVAGTLVKSGKDMRGATFVLRNGGGAWFISGIFGVEWSS